MSDIMAPVLTARIPQELSHELDRICREEHLDRSTLARRFLEQAISEHRTAQAVKKYSSGQTTLRGAAKLARLPLWAFLDELAKRDAVLPYDAEELDEDLRAVNASG